ncbi:uncharacterized protein LOC123520626 isoform X2 [Portunus trituberculatus]|uniref:uncharacterized protein LOC123520626 isoform X2 n=1 Tax=Portunus trituberculatus TaxID=210409 RepID=UPI001E1CB8A5|nr:uncharacterized protein LOC123520626 isoform X2 [Portunus trituberculatus]
MAAAWGRNEPVYIKPCSVKQRQRLVAPVTGVTGEPPQRRFLPQETRLQYARTIATSILSRTPPGAQLIGARGDLPPLIDRLVYNASSIRRNIVDTFDCNGRVYGYYADQDNDCQIFHICVPMQQLFPDLYDFEDIFHFSFICPGYTIFSQDSMTCDWEDWAFPCPQASELYHRNNHFFVVPAEDVQRTSTTPSSTSTTQTPRSTPSPSPSSTPSRRPPSFLLRASTLSPPKTSPSPSSTPSPNLSPSSSSSPSPSPSPSPTPIPIRRSSTRRRGFPLPLTHSSNLRAAFRRNRAMLLFSPSRR